MSSSSLSPFGRIAGLSVISVILSNLVCNVPAVMLLKPLTQTLGAERILWLALAMSSTLAGNLTLIGSVANLIVAQQARRRVEIGFMEYFRVGALITVVTIVIGILILAIEVRTANSAEAVTVENADQQVTVKVTPRGHADGRLIFTVVLLCDTFAMREKGLQGFRPLRPEEAALFVFDKPEAVTFWMGSVTFPIDIVFISPGGYVVEVAPRCKPGSPEFYGSGVPVKWVIETAAGSGIMVGDTILIQGQGPWVK